MPSDEIILRPYPSGFLGSALVKNTAPIDQERMRHRMFSHSAISDLEGRPASLIVAQLWDLISSGVGEVRTFEFHEQVLAHALVVFGRQCWTDWVVAQKQAPNYDSYHCQWLIETLEYVHLGKPRKLTCFNWVALLAAAGDDVSRADEIKLDELLYDIGEPALDTFLQMWLTQPGGFEDLLQSLHVLFGGR